MHMCRQKRYVVNILTPHLRAQSLFGDKLYGEGNGSLSFGEYLATVVAGGHGGNGGGNGAGGKGGAAATAKAG